MIDKSLMPQTVAVEAEEKPIQQDPLLDSALEIMGGKIVEE
jgi:hypothetical protein